MRFVDTLTKGKAEVRAGTLHPSTYAAMSVGVKVLIDMYGQAENVA
ncbi:MAG: hypothetical protein OXI52_13325 [Caldilineaceae bacterium]|nr:hypothetical protein [Caldilineaceae bacterium]